LYENHNFYKFKMHGKLWLIHSNIHFNKLLETTSNILNIVNISSNKQKLITGAGTKAQSINNEKYELVIK